MTQVSLVIKRIPKRLIFLTSIIVFSMVLYSRPVQALEPLPHEYNGSIKINGMSIPAYLERLSDAAAILEVDLEKITFDLHLKIEGHRARTRLGQSVRVDSSSQYRNLYVDPGLENLTIEDNSLVSFHLRSLRSSEHEMEATEYARWEIGRWKVSGEGREPLMDLSFTDPDWDSDGLNNLEETILGLDAENPDADLDGLLDGEEVFPGNDGYITNPKDRDSDDDGLTDWQEVKGIGLDKFTSDPWKKDTDNDGLSDSDETSDINGWITNPTNPDSDNDGLGDKDEIKGSGPNRQVSNPTRQDSDEDGLLDAEEVFAGKDGYITKPMSPHSDADGLTDGEEFFGSGPKLYRSNPLKVDTDLDGLNDNDEVFGGQYNYITDPKSFDTDGDGLSDGQEILGSGLREYTSDPLVKDSDKDGILDFEEVFAGEDGYITDPGSNDTDKDGLQDADEIDGNNDHNFPSDPTLQDTDSDGIPDNLEVGSLYGFISNPMESDTDADLLDDNLEVNKYRTDPSNPDTDGDGINDNLEVTEYRTDPNNPDTDGDGINDLDELTPIDQGYNYFFYLGIPILILLAISALIFWVWTNFIRRKFYASIDDISASRTQVYDEARSRILKEIITGYSDSRDYRITTIQMSNHVKDSIGDLTRRWPPNEIAYTVDKISMDLGSDRSGHDHSFEFIAMFAPLNNEITSAISTLAEDWWGFIPMEVLALSAAPEFIYQDQHWSVHPLAVSLLRSILDLRYSDLTIIPETGLDPGNMEHGYLFHTILSEY